MNYLLTSVFTSILFLSLTQTLVPNPSFEHYSQCPDQVGQIHRLIGWKVFNSQTPDYMNSCATNPGLSTPINVFGEQEPLTGNAYTGAYFYTDSYPNGGREVIGIQLVSPLQIGQKYHVNFNVSLALGITKAACNKIGVKFSTVDYNETDWIPIDNHAHVYTNDVIEDSINWTQIYGSFVADSAYEYIAIGNFFDDTNTIIVPYDNSNFYTAYYFIDDVCVSADPSACGLSVSIEELPAQKKEIVKILDITGRETEDRPNTILFYLYNDGTIEKVFRFE